ncbi:Uracil phosphoribosyltransferase [Drechslerella dactyloides]|uniref:uracil phosphoribosyltransferase n=1 Tax=Drechslerella dactyloides TaxID=74499 RepID=A0AAD6NLB2_DREDA|nr:Uracil phosphoribosyltransferase [Drechslerella dactyloides]
MSNIHVSNHPCVKAKLSQLRSATAGPRETKALIHEISTLLAAEALAASLSVAPAGQDTTPLGAEYAVEKVAEKVVLVPILRSGLGMIDGTSPSNFPFVLLANTHLPAFNDLLPTPAAIHHLGLFRERATLSPVEYYNNLPTSSAAAGPPADLAIILDPVVATGGTAIAAIQTLRDWGVRRIILCSVLGAKKGVDHAAGEWPEGVQVYLGGLDPGTNEQGMILPGLGDIGDRLFLTIGK